MHCRILLPLTLAAMFFAASPAHSQRVPLILAETIPLPASSDVWDVMPHPDGYYVWVQATEPDTETTRISWGQTDIGMVDSFVLSVGTPFQIFAFFSENHQPCFVLSSTYVDSLDVDQAYFQAFRISDRMPISRQWHWRSYEFELVSELYWQWRSGDRLAVLVPLPSPPQISTGVLGLVAFWRHDAYPPTVRDWFEAKLIPNLLSSDSVSLVLSRCRYADWYLSPRYSSISYAGEYHLFSTPTPPFPSVYETRTNVNQLYLNENVPLDSALFHCSEPNYDPTLCHLRPVASTYDVLSGATLSFTVLGTDYGAVRSSLPNQSAWTIPGPYDFWFAAECVPSNSAEEFLCYNRSRRVFDVLDAVDGHSYGVTDTIDIATSGARIIGRYDSTFRRLVIRDSTSLKLYRFGEYLAADEHGAPLPSDLNLAAYPNPFNPSTTIRFTLPRRSEAELVVYDVSGRQIAVLVDGVLATGEHRVPFDGARLPSGIYFARLTAAGAQITQKLLLLK